MTDFMNVLFSSPWVYFGSLLFVLIGGVSLGIPAQAIRRVDRSTNIYSGRQPQNFEGGNDE